MEKLTLDQVQMLLILFQIQNAERDIEDFVDDFHSFRYGFSKYKKIKDLFLFDSWLKASDDDDDDEWGIIGFCTISKRFERMCFETWDNRMADWYSFDIMKYISLKDKV